jgi:outer membrane protein W
MRKLLLLILVLSFSFFVNIYAKTEEGPIDPDIAKEIAELEKQEKVVHNENILQKAIFGDFDKKPFSFGTSVPSVSIEESSTVSSAVIFFLQYKLNKFGIALYYVLGANIEPKTSEQGVSGKVILSSPLIVALKYYYVDDPKKFRLYCGVGEQYSLISHDSLIYTANSIDTKLKTKLENNGLNPIFLLGAETQLTSDFWILIEMNLGHFSARVTGISGNDIILPVNTIRVALGFKIVF